MIKVSKYLTITNFTPMTNKENLYIVLHYTANDGDTAMNNAKYFYDKNRSASAHYFVDEFETIQVVEDYNKAWHCGGSTYIHDKCRNYNSIGIEMCSRKDSEGEYYIKNEVIEKTKLLVLDLMQKYDIPLSNVIRHYDVTGKSCPRPMVKNPSLWTNFKNDLSTGEVLEEESTLKLSKWAEEGYDYVVAKGISDGSNPKGMVTREELWTMLERMSNIDKT